MQNNGKGLQITGLVLGIVALVLCWYYMVNIVALVLAVVALILSIMGRKQAAAAGASSGLGTAALVVSIIALVLSVIMFFACTVCICAAGTAVATDGSLQQALNDLASLASYAD